MGDRSSRESRVDSREGHLWTLDSRRSTARWGIAAALLVPSMALAAGADPLDFGSGVVADLAAKVAGFARGWLVFSFILGLVLEMFGRAPGQPRHYAGVVWRFFVVSILLTQYAFVFGSVKRTIDAATARLAPGQGDFLSGVESLTRGLDAQDPGSKSAIAQLTSRLRGAQGQYDAALASGDANATSSARGLVSKLSSALKEAEPGMWGSIGGVLFDTLCTFVFLFAELAHLVVSRLGVVLAAAFYVLGPLALVFSIPTFSRVGHAWFKRYVTYCCWPLISAILLKLVLALLLAAKAPTSGGSQVAQNLFLASMMILTALCVPSIASELIGGSASNFLAMGAARAVSAARSLAHAVTRDRKSKEKSKKDAKKKEKDGIGAGTGAAGSVVANGASGPRANAPDSTRAMSGSSGPVMVGEVRDAARIPAGAGGAREGAGRAKEVGHGAAIGNSPARPGARPEGGARTPSDRPAAEGGRLERQGAPTAKSGGDGAVALPRNGPAGPDSVPPKPPPDYEEHEDVTR